MRMTLNRAAMTASATGACPCKAAKAEAEDESIKLLKEAEQRAEASNDSGCGCSSLTVSPAEGETFQDDDVDDKSDSDRVAWTGVLAMEDTPTGDGREIEGNALIWDTDEGLPLRWTREDEGGHFRAVRVGTITDIFRDGSEIRGEGYILTDVEESRMVLDWLDEGRVGVSVDLDSVSVEWVYELGDDGDPVDIEKALITEARIRAATLVDIPAFAEAFIERSDRDHDSLAASARPRADALVASSVNAAIPIEPPLEWFRRDGGVPSAPYRAVPEMNGRVHGYIATWGTCHSGYSDRCVTAPRSRSGYREFLRSPVHTEDGVDVLTGPMFFATRHADPSRNAVSAVEFYENTGKVAADVVVGEDRHGIWVAGALRPTVTPEQIREIRAAHPSGDWRSRNGSLELVSALLVTDPGFPVPSLAASAHVVDDEITSLQIVWNGDKSDDESESESGSGSIESDELNRKLALIDIDMKMRRRRQTVGVDG